MMKILVVDDEQDICEILQYNLEADGYEVDITNSAEEALMLPLGDYSLILLDVMMGEMSGFDMVKEMKRHAITAYVPVIFITALGDEENMLSGFNIGADDYIAKPLSMKEVKARVTAVLRRTTIEKTKGNDEKLLANVEYGTMLLNTENKTLFISGKEIQLTKIEFSILELLVKNAGRMFSRDDLLENCWPTNTIVLERTVDVNITRLRKKIGQYGKNIKTRFGYGYTFEK